MENEEYYLNSIGEKIYVDTICWWAEYDFKDKKISYLHKIISSVSLTHCSASSENTLQDFHETEVFKTKLGAMIAIAEYIEKINKDGSI